MNKVIKLSCLVLISLFISFIAFAMQNGHENMPGNNMKKVGVLLASHGDIDDLSELKPYLKKAMLHMAPFPKIVSSVLFELSWPIERIKMRKQYEAFGVKTEYRKNSKDQADALTEQLKLLGIDGKAYVGLNLISPTIFEALDQMEEDGVTHVIVINQGAQFSMATEMNYMDIMHYLEENPDYKPQIIGINQYSYDNRFRELLVDALKKDIKRNISDESEEVCMLMAFHGVPMKVLEKGDKSIGDMLDLYEYVQNNLSDYNLYHGFLNEDSIPGAKWTTPTVQETGKLIGDSSCNNVLLDSRISLTIHPRVSFYNLNIEARNEILKRNPYANVILLNNFDGDAAFAEFLAQITKEALHGEGDIQDLKKHDMGHMH